VPLTALYARERPGRGQHVDVAMLDTALVLMSSFVTDCVTGGAERGLVGNRSGRGNYVHNSFNTEKGVLLIAASTELRRSRLWKALDMSDIHSDARFTTPVLCRQNVDALEAEVQKRLLTKPAEEWEQILQAAGVTAMMVRTIPEIVKHPQIVARDLFHTFNYDSILGQCITVLKTGYKLSATPARLNSQPPRVGQHTDEILGTLGISAADIARLRTTGIV